MPQRGNHHSAEAVVSGKLGVLQEKQRPCLGPQPLGNCRPGSQPIIDHSRLVLEFLTLFAINAFKVMVAIISPVKDYSPIGDLTEGRAITWGQLGRAYSYIWGVTGLLISGLGMLIFTRRQLAITDSNE